MTTFSDLLCECPSCEFYRDNLTSEQLATEIPYNQVDTYLVEFELKVVNYREKFQVSVLEIPASILQIIFDKPFK